jgi:hypothetical protein
MGHSQQRAAAALGLFPLPAATKHEEKRRKDRIKKKRWNEHDDSLIDGDGDCCSFLSFFSSRRT